MNWDFHVPPQRSAYFVSFGHLADNLPCGRVDGREGFLADCIVPFIVDENLQVQHPTVRAKTLPGQIASLNGQLE